MSQPPGLDVDEFGHQKIEESAGNKIVELDPNEELSEGSEGFKYEHLSYLCDQLSAVGADGQSALLEIERRHMADNPEHVLRFTTKELTAIAVSLCIAHTANRYQFNENANDVIRRFGYLIKRHEDAPIDGTFGDVHLPGMEPVGDDEEINPFKVIKGHQPLVFVDEDGNALDADDVVPVEE